MSHPNTGAARTADKAAAQLHVFLGELAEWDVTVHDPTDLVREPGVFIYCASPYRNFLIAARASSAKLAALEQQSPFSQEDTAKALQYAMAHTSPITDTLQGLPLLAWLYIRSSKAHGIWKASRPDAGTPAHFLVVSHRPGLMRPAILTSTAAALLSSRELHRHCGAIEDLDRQWHPEWWPT